ncbi:MAG: DNA polymerase I [Bdellovibrionales bacterium CG10_big_fil_rev_8_21_14_0_10_45_34]|nr:MAG: DNA polymerase I [Bdellovibrionales bacterium CG10_big_fil_rev_8_21_14_0_10_45_34]
MGRVYLVDVSSMYFRSFYAIRELTNSKGFPTNALYGFLTMTSKLINDHKPEMIAYCFDRKEPSFRKDLFVDYKANRSEMPEGLVPQVPYIRQLSELIGIPCFDQQGYEADDIIGTIACWAVNNSHEAIIISGDKDFAQLVNSRISIYDPMKELTYSSDGVVEKWGIKPDQVIDYLALVGDSSDNIPGVRGIGPKGAVKLLQEYTNLEGIYENLHYIKNKSLQTKLEAGKESAFLSRKLATIECNIPLDLSVGKLSKSSPRSEELRVLLREFEFKSLETKLLGSESKSVTIKSDASKSDASKSDPSMNDARRSDHAKNSKVFEVTGGIQNLSIPNVFRSNGGGFLNDTQGEENLHESTPAHGIPMPAAVFQNSSQMQLELQSESVVVSTAKEISLSQAQEYFERGEAIWAYIDGEYLHLTKEKDGIAYKINSQEAVLLDWLNSRDFLWSAHSLQSVWRRFPVRTPKAKFDLCLAGYVLDPGQKLHLSDLTQRYLGFKVPEYLTAEKTHALYRKLEEEFRKSLKRDSLEYIYNDVDLPLLSVLHDMEERGILIDPSQLSAQAADLTKDIKSIEAKIHKEAGEAFLISSPKQLSVILFEKLKLPVIKKIKTGFSTDSDVLQKLIDKHPICKMIVDYRELTKLKSTYVDALPEIMDPATHRVHSEFNLTVTTTGRLSSTNPNLQNIPIRTERGAKVRNAFVANVGQKLISADYSQIELRVIAHLTGDRGLISAFERDQDIHSATASEIFSTDITQVTSEQRRVAKAVNFGLAYGMGAHGLSENLGIPRKEAASIIERYFLKFPQVQGFMVSKVEEAHQKGYVTTLFGRRRYLPELKSRLASIRKFGERAAINAPAQGTAADIVKLAMLSLRSCPAQMLLQVHDELVFECNDADVGAASELITEKMESAAKLNVPLKVNLGVGQNWGDAH